MTDGGRRGESKYRSAARIARLGACESARGPDADRHVKLLIQFPVKGSLSGAYSHDCAGMSRLRESASARITWDIEPAARVAGRSPSAQLLSLRIKKAVRYDQRLQLFEPEPLSASHAAWLA